MANDNHLPLSNNSLDSRPSPLYSTDLTERNGDWAGVPSPAAPLGGTGMPDMMGFAHALRRHWLLAFGIGLFCAAIVGPLVWFGIGAKYTSRAVFQVAMRDSNILTAIADTSDATFDIYKNTQISLIKNRFVLAAALNRPGVSDLPIVQEQKVDGGDAVAWLESCVQVAFPNKSELMVLSVTREDQQEAAKLASAVVDAYMTEVVGNEQTKKQSRCNELAKVCDAKELIIRNKRQELKNLASQNNGVINQESLSLQQKLALEELSMTNQHLMKMQVEMGQLAAQLAGQKALLKNVDETDVPAVELDALIRLDPIASNLSMELARMKMFQSSQTIVAKQGTTNPHVNRISTELENLQKQYDNQIADIHKKARQKNRRTIEATIVQLESELLVLQQQRSNMEAASAKMREDSKKFGNASLEVEMLAIEIKQLEAAAASFSAERQKLEVELNAKPRINLLEKPDVPLQPSNKLSRIALTFFATLLSFFAPIAAVIMFDIRSHRINTASDVSKGLHLPVIGAVPLIPSRVIRQMASPSSRYRMWHLRLTESVDGVMARLLRKANLEQCRVIMVASAAGGEGKTTLATQLALSLARTGRHTVLVDFDLRRPAFDEVFGLPLTPGVSESLRRECSVNDMLRQTATECLSVITAGQWDRQALASLSNGGAAVLFDQLREKFEFVVFDTSPILPIADPRFVSQFVDTVVLSVFRDISEAPKIQAACDILTAFGVQSIEAVVTGPNVNAYGKHMGYESTITA